MCLLIIALTQRRWDLRDLQKRHHERNKDISERLRQKTQEELEMTKDREEQAMETVVLDDVTKVLGYSQKGLEVERSKVENEKDNLETQVISLKYDAIKRDTNHNTAKASLARENKKLPEDKHSQQKRLQEKSEEVKQLEEDKRNQQKRLEGKSKLVSKLVNKLGSKLGKGSGGNAKAQVKKWGDNEKQGKKAEEELKVPQSKLDDLRIGDNNLEESRRESEGKRKQKVEGQPTGIKEERSKIKNATGVLEQKFNLLLDEGKQRDADLEQLQTKCERMEKVRDAVLGEVRAQKGASKRNRDLEERKRLEGQAKDQENPNLTTEGICTPQLNILEDADGALEDGAEGAQDTADTPKKAGGKRRYRRRKPRDSNRCLPTEAETDKPSQQNQTKRSALSEENLAPEDETLSTASTEGIEEEASDPDEGPSELPNDISPAKHRRPGKRNSKRDHKFEAEKRKRKREEKKAGMACLAGSGPEGTHEKK